VKKSPFITVLASFVLTPASGWAASCLGTTGYTCTTINDQVDNNPPNTATPETFTQLLGINNVNNVVGYYGSGTLPDHPNKGIFIPNAFALPPVFVKENFPTSVQTQVIGINNVSSPTTVGFWADAGGNNFGFDDVGGTFKTVVNPATPVAPKTVNQLLGVNNSNVAVGFYADSAGNNHGYMFNIGTLAFTPVNLPASFNAVSVMATGINNAGIVVGLFTDTAGNTHGFINNAGSFTSFNDPNGPTNTSFFGINNHNDVVGSYVDAAGANHGLWFDPATKTFLTVDDPNQSGTAGTILNGINDANSLVGFYGDANGGTDGMLASIPEPASLSLMGLAALAAGCLYRRKRRSA
jgi:probable HAF family extracellular repeat protein